MDLQRTSICGSFLIRLRVTVRTYKGKDEKHPRRGSAQLLSEADGDFSTHITRDLVSDLVLSS